MLDAQKAEALYGKDAAEWLRRWDSGETCHSIEMGGIGPGYEQCIQIVAAEVLRHLIAEKFDPARWDDDKTRGEEIDKLEKFGFANAKIKDLDITHMQWGAAVNLACQIYRNGPVAVMQDKRVKDRHIVVSNTWPTSLTSQG